MANRLKTFFTLCSGSLTLLTVGGFAGRLWWPLELLDHLRWHYLWCLLPCLLYFFAERHAVASVALLFAITINAFLLFPLFQPLPATTSSESLTLQHINIDKEKREALACAQTEQSDLLFL